MFYTTSKKTQMYRILVKILAITFFICSCKEKILREEEYYPNGGLKKMTLSNVNGLKTVCQFYENGEIAVIHRYNFNKDRQFAVEQLWFYPSGTLDRKIPLINGKASACCPNSIYASACINNTSSYRMIS